jgi:hypothetical protein
MLRFARNAACLLAAGFFLVACGDNQDDAGSRKLLVEITDEKYREWYRPPGWEERVLSDAPHGDSVDIYVNAVVEEVLTRGEAASEWPLGSLIVKDGFNGESQVYTAVMEKREDGWYYAEFDSAGDPYFSGRPSLCINCHASGSDYVRAFALPK